ncbi:formate dehydrogenase subunit gamma [Desulfonatronovibrio hydrogenovorans]|uniref:formate dehydrogenase subunit gamma n=1 Tax=Desulfonatronovibrio hydrogenovorans TaxID=53245 RepID=UPI00048DCEC6|nr:cytochrome b/b6 domain-containing protein [Desulfonatronovibrio hydrogenovorans]RQD64672.1 MAG: hypothetical protein D5R98_04735 [Desulfonatronovibrio sp. MSAO_Bac4]
MSNNSSEILIQRFNKRRRFVHWLHTFAFFGLLCTGVLYTTPLLSQWTESGLAGTLHRYFAVIFLLAPFVYIVIDPKGFREFISDTLKFEKSDIGFHLAMPRYILGHTGGIPPQGKLNAGHKIHHILMGILYLALAISGLSMWLGVGYMGPPVFNFMGVLHNIAVFIIVITTLGHVYFTLVYWALPGMISGKVSETYVRMEHKKWWDEELAPKLKGSSPKSGS